MSFDLNRAFGELSARGGGELMIPAGIYRAHDLTLGREITRPTTIWGHGPATVIRTGGQGSGIRVMAAQARVTIADLTFEGDLDTPWSRPTHENGIRAGIAVYNPWEEESSGGSIRNCSVSDFLSFGVLIRDGANWDVMYCRIRNIGLWDEMPDGTAEWHAPTHDDPRTAVNEMESQLWNGYGIQIMGPTTHDCVVERNFVEWVSKIGIQNFSQPVPNRGMVVRDNMVRWTRAGGIVFNGGRDGIIEHNAVTQCGFGIVTSTAATNIRIHGNAPFHNVKADYRAYALQDIS